MMTLDLAEVVLFGTLWVAMPTAVIMLCVYDVLQRTTPTPDPPPWPFLQQNSVANPYVGHLYNLHEDLGSEP